MIHENKSNYSEYVTLHPQGDCIESGLWDTTLVTENVLYSPIPAYL